MLRTLVAALAVAAVALPAAPSWAVPAVDQPDPRGDVTTLASPDAVDSKVLRAADLRHLKVTHHADGLRVVVRVRQVLPARGHLAQVLLFDALTNAGDAEDESGQEVSAFVVLQHPGGSRADMAPIAEQPNGQEPRPETCRVDVKPSAKRVRLDIPARCVPPGAGFIEAEMIVLDKHEKDDPLIAADDISVGGSGWFSPFRLWEGGPTASG